MHQFLLMGGYAAYVWPCYAITALVAALNVRWALSLLRAAQREARRRIASRESGT